MGVSSFLSPPAEAFAFLFVSLDKERKREYLYGQQSKISVALKGVLCVWKFKHSVFNVLFWAFVFITGGLAKTALPSQCNYRFTLGLE